MHFIRPYADIDHDAGMYQLEDGINEHGAGGIRYYSSNSRVNTERGATKKSLANSCARSESRTAGEKILKSGWRLPLRTPRP
jgi:hypothetical protein